MIVAGIGCKRGVSPTAVLAAVDAALAEYRRERADISRLATGATKRDEAAIVIAAGTLGVPLHYVGDEALADVAGRLITSSERSKEATGSPSLSEASALAVSGENGTLLGPRVITGPATCALAEMGEDVIQKASGLLEESSGSIDEKRPEVSAPPTPTPNPSPQGGGGLARHNSSASERIAAGSPSPLWGGVRGGGNVGCNVPAPSEKHRVAPRREARP